MSNIKVYLRIKPNENCANNLENKNGQNGTKAFPSKPTHDFKIIPTKFGKTLSIKSDKKPFNDRRFEFEDIFEPEIGQAELFEQFQEKIIESATNGVP